ncbi:SHOCT domain-containing protein [Halostella litorea]|uniref:SHOCT domain-containing protein n=1 Tax=Halostella litorea TaxID=2528831 RepID=UPI0010918C57|nr:SHOCT domain-containing protein [Halostella litorea]
MVSRHWLYFGGFVVSGILLVGVGLLGAIDALSVLSGGAYYGEEFVLLAMLAAAAEWVAAGVVLGLFAAVFLAATVVSVLRNASVPRSDRLVAVVEWLEREYPVLRRIDASDRVAPTAEDRRQRLRERYVEGELSEREFERELERVLDEGSDGGSRSGSDTTVEFERRSK